MTTVITDTILLRAQKIGGNLKNKEGKLIE